MRKTISLDSDTYDKLERFRGKRETFSDAVDRLLTLLDRVGMLRDIIEGGIKFDDLKRQAAAQSGAKDHRADTNQMSDVQSRQVGGSTAYVSTQDVQVPEPKEEPILDR